MDRRGSGIIKGLALVAFLAAFAPLVIGVPARSAELELKLAHIGSQPSIYGTAAESFAENVGELSAGAIHVTAYHGGVLGNLQQLLGQLKSNVLDMTLIDVAGIAVLDGAKHFQVFSAPYLFRDQAHLRRFFQGDQFRGIMAEVEQEVGIKYIGYLGDRAPRALTTRNRAVRSPEDLKGLKIRTPLAPFITALWRAWGAQPISVKASDMYMALQTGMADGQDNGVRLAAGMGLFEIQKFYSPIDHMRSGVGLFMSGSGWNDLTAEQRGWLVEAARMVGDAAQSEYETAVAEGFAKAKAAGVTVVEVDMAAFEAAAREIVEDYDGKAWPKGLYRRIQNSDDVSGLEPEGGREDKP